METIDPRAAYLETGPFLLTVIVRAQADGDFLRGVLAHLRGQRLFTQGKMQVMVVGGTEVEGIVAECAATDAKRFVFVQGVQAETDSAARNRAIKKSRAAYLMFVDPGDFLAGEAAERLAGILDKRPEISVVYAAGGWEGGGEFSREAFFDGEGLGWPVMWRRALHQRLGFFDADLRFAGEYEFWLRVATRHLFAFVPERLGERAADGKMSDADVDLRQRELIAARNRYWINSWGEHPQEKRIRRCFEGLGERLAGLPVGTRVALFGAGKHTGRLLEQFRAAIEPRCVLAAILDDRAGEGQAMGGIRVMHTDRWREAGIEAVVVSSDAYEAAMGTAARRATGGEIPVHGLYLEGRDHVPARAAVDVLR